MRAVLLLAYACFALAMCPGGYYCPDLVTQLLCANGMHCPPGSTAQSLCPSSNYCASPTAIAPCSDVCPAGSTSETSCPLHNHCASTAQIPCDPGTFCPPGSYEQLLCAEGFYCPTPTDQIPCRANAYCPAGSTAEGACPADARCENGTMVTTTHVSSSTTAPLTNTTFAWNATYTTNVTWNTTVAWNATNTTAEWNITNTTFAWNVTNTTNTTFAWNVTNTTNTTFAWNVTNTTNTTFAWNITNTTWNITNTTWNVTTAGFFSFVTGTPVFASILGLEVAQAGANVSTLQAVLDNAQRSCSNCMIDIVWVERPGQNTSLYCTTIQECFQLGFTTRRLLQVPTVYAAFLVLSMRPFTPTFNTTCPPPCVSLNSRGNVLVIYNTSASRRELADKVLQSLVAIVQKPKPKAAESSGLYIAVGVIAAVAFVLSFSCKALRRSRRVGVKPDPIPYNANAARAAARINMFRGVKIKV